MFRTIYTTLSTANLQNKVDLLEDRIDSYCRTIQDTGAPLANYWAFLDGTVKQIFRPGMGQQAVYNGRKRKHALKHQGVVSIDSTIQSLWGPFEERRHDTALLLESDLLDVLEVRFYNYVVYGDSEYPLRTYLMI